MISFTLLVGLAYFCLCLETWETHPAQTLPTIVWVVLLAVASLCGMHWFYLIFAVIVIAIYIPCIGDESLLLIFGVSFVFSMTIVAIVRCLL